MKRPKQITVSGRVEELVAEQKVLRNNIVRCTEAADECTKAARVMMAMMDRLKGSNPTEHNSMVKQITVQMQQSIYIIRNK